MHPFETVRAWKGVLGCAVIGFNDVGDVLAVLATGVMTLLAVKTVAIEYEKMRIGCDARK